MELLMYSSSSALVCSAGRKGSGSHLSLSLPGAMLHLTDCCLHCTLLVCPLITQCGFSLLERLFSTQQPSRNLGSPGSRTLQPGKGALVQLVPSPCEFSLCCWPSPGFHTLSLKLGQCPPFFNLWGPLQLCSYGFTVFVWELSCSCVVVRGLLLEPHALQTFCEVFRPSDVSAAISARRAIAMKCLFSRGTCDVTCVFAKCAVCVLGHTHCKFFFL